jgi:hypothetical protein
MPCVDAYFITNHAEVKPRQALNTYSEKRKAAITRRMIPPDNRLVAALARENMITERNHFYTAAKMRNPALVRYHQKLGGRTRFGSIRSATIWKSLRKSLRKSFEVTRQIG